LANPKRPSRRIEQKTQSYNGSSLDLLDHFVWAAKRINQHVEADGAAVFAAARRMGLEGVVSKRVDAPYRSGRSHDRIETKNPDADRITQTLMDHLHGVDLRRAEAGRSFV
jgi:hypothetical protein